jgi:Tfp pilus assembly protein PilE
MMQVIKGICMTLHHNQTLEKSGGFTLIEVVIYLALFAMLFGGAVLAAYNVIEGSGRNQTRAQLQEEGQFLLAKISWVLSGAQAVNSPTANAQSSILSLVKYGGSSFTVSASGSNVQLQNSTGTYILNSSSVALLPGSLKFAHDIDIGNGTNPERVKTDFTLTTRTPGGAVISQDFSTLSYLRK